MRGVAPVVFEWSGLPQPGAARAELRRRLKRYGFESLYTHVRAFHGCRPDDIASYLTHGLRPLSRRTTIETARRQFLGKGQPPVTEAALTEALERILRDRANGRVYVAIDERHLLRYCGHYMVYGSEALAGVAASLTRQLGWNVQPLLLTAGAPTVFVLNVPCSFIPSVTLVELTDAVVGELGHAADSEPSDLDFALVLNRKLLPSSIVRYYSVIRVHDPIRWQEHVHRGGSSLCEKPAPHVGPR